MDGYETNKYIRIISNRVTAIIENDEVIKAKYDSLIAQGADKAILDDILFAVAAEA